jgi:hypothetical protein
MDNEAKTDIPKTNAQTKLFLCNSDVLLEEDENVTPVEVDCLTFVREKLQSNLAHFYHPFFGNPKVTKWPTVTDIACLHCCECFETIPVPSVRRFDELRNIYYVYGIFCSINCAKSYLMEHEVSISTMRLLHFNHMCRNVYNIHSPVKPAPPRMRLKKFGGDLTILQFRNNFTHITTQIIEPPFVQNSLLCEERMDISQHERDKNSSCSILPDHASSSSSSSSSSVSSSTSQNGLYSQFIDQKTMDTHGKEEMSEQTTLIPTRKRKKPKGNKEKQESKSGGLDAFLTFR